VLHLGRAPIEIMPPGDVRVSRPVEVVVISLPLFLLVRTNPAGILTPIRNRTKAII
jgi:hypothetical protein